MAETTKQSKRPEVYLDPTTCKCVELHEEMSAGTQWKVLVYPIRCLKDYVPATSAGLIKPTADVLSQILNFK